jgi:hypothetical protein
MDITPHVSREDKILLKFYQALLPKVEARENTFSIIIQGPLNDRSIKTIPTYLSYGQVIVSCWDNDDLSKLDPYLNQIDLVVNNYADALPKAMRTHHRNPIILQNFTTHNALKKATGHFTIKTRSDESWPVLDPLLNMLRTNRDTKNPETGIYNDYKIITSNIYFRYDKQCKFHPSDHLIAGRTYRMKDIFYKTYMDCILGRIAGVGPEELIGKSVISTYRDPTTKYLDIPFANRSVELMKKHFDMIRVSSLPRRIWTSSYRKYDALSGEEDWCHHINDIDRYN